MLSSDSDKRDVMLEIKTEIRFKMLHKLSFETIKFNEQNKILLSAEH